MSNNKFKVLIVEDEANICSFIETLLTTNDYQALVAHTCTMGLTLFASHNPDLVILDLGLPDRDGLEFIRTVRQKYMTPIVVLSARTDEMDKIEALDLGANDYITKPFGMMEFVARVKAVLRRCARQSEERELHCKDLRVNVSRHEVSYQGEVKELTRKEFELLEYLMENKGLVMSRNQILCHVWGYDFDGETRTVDVHVRTLRQKLGEAGNLIETVRGVGYRIGDHV
mgnify:CR=1 FL=1